MKQKRQNVYFAGNKPKYQYTLDYLLDFHSAYQNEKRFAIAMLKELTASDVTLARNLDSSLREFLRLMAPFLTDTIVVLMSDHGVLPKQVSLANPTNGLY